MDREAQFQELRPLLFALAYRMLGTRADAEDVVQEAWLRWQAADADVRSPKSFLTTVVARLALDALKSAHRKRETYTGPWLPEPLVEPSGAGPIEMAESLSLAFLHVLESLSPPERVAFLLHEAFDTGYAEIASVLDTSEANCRQLVRRARQHLHERRPRFAVDRVRHQQVLEQFLATCATGDPAPLTVMLSERVVVYSDGGGKVPSALQPVQGADRVARLLTGLARKGAAGGRVEFAEINGEPGAVLIAQGTPVSVISIDIGPDGLIRGVFLVNNPQKLAAAASIFGQPSLR